MKYKPATVIAKLKSAARNKRREYGGSTEESEVLEQAASMIHELVSELSKRPRIPESGDIGDLSDGYHTFNQLYYQRMVLFQALVRLYRDRAWKSRRHEDGEICFGGGWFVVGIDTPEGSYTYHYEEKDFDAFDCVELPVAKHWDGHTEKDVTRLLSLPLFMPDEKTALAMTAGASAIRRAGDYYLCTSHVWDVHGNYGGPKEIDYFEAAQILADLSHESLMRQVELHASAEARNENS